jgi:hypothetical protein
MSQTVQQCSGSKSYVHSQVKYQSLNNKEQTPAIFVVGQRYQLGTAIALVQGTGDNSLEKTIVMTNCEYKTFLSHLLQNPSKLEEMLSFKWIPKRVVRQENILKLKCGQKCVSGNNGSGCIVPGCLCNGNNECV